MKAWNKHSAFGVRTSVARVSTIQRRLCGSTGRPIEFHAYRAISLNVNISLDTFGELDILL